MVSSLSASVKCSRAEGSESRPGMFRIRAFTSAAVNYLPKVRLLCSSIKQHHPEFEVYWAVADAVPDWLDVSKEPIDGIVRIEELNIANTKGWVFGHTIAELSTAIKPFVVRYLLGGDMADAVLYFDPDMVLFSRLDDLLSEFRQDSILLTPHQTKPETRLEAVIDNEICSLRHGIFNLGFLGVRNDKDGRAFVDWWGERLYHFCHESLERHLWTDQKWVNFAPVFFDGVKILKSPRFNVAPWNITTRHVSGSLADGFRVDGEPLGFYHFTGFDSGDHKIMAAKYGGDNKAIMSLVKWYERESKLHKESEITGTRWAFSCFSNGEPVTKAHRVIYRTRPDLQAAYTNPFHVNQSLGYGSGDARSYFDWFNWRANEEYPELVTAPPSARPTHIPHQMLVRRVVGSGSSYTLDWSRIGRNLKLCLGNRQYAGSVMRRVWGIWRREGARGVVTRLHRRRSA